MNAEALCAKTKPAPPKFVFDLEEFNEAVKEQYSTVKGIAKFDFFQMASPYSDDETTYQLNLYDSQHFTIEGRQALQRDQAEFMKGKFSKMFPEEVAYAILYDWVAKGYLPPVCEVWVDCTL